MKVQRILFFLASFLWVFNLQHVSGDGEIKVQLVKFANPSHKTASGICCDNGCGECDSYFIIKINHITQTETNVLTEKWTEDFLTDDITFGRTLCYDESWCSNIIPNPFSVTVPKLTGVFQLEIGVWDNDFGANKLNHHRNMFIASWKRNISYSEASLTLTAGSIKFDVKTSVSCKLGYLKPNCNVYCANNSDHNGHYYCDFHLGLKVCLPGWYGLNCTLTKQDCVPHDNFLGHYSCNNVTGAKVCLPGWKNVTENCTESDSVTTKMSSMNLLFASISSKLWLKSSSKLEPQQNYSTYIKQYDTITSFTKFTSNPSSKWTMSSGISVDVSLSKQSQRLTPSLYFQNFVLSSHILPSVIKKTNPNTNSLDVMDQISKTLGNSDLFLSMMHTIRSEPSSLLQNSSEKRSLASMSSKWNKVTHTTVPSNFRFPPSAHGKSPKINYYTATVYSLRLSSEPTKSTDEIFKLHYHFSPNQRLSPSTSLINTFSSKVQQGKSPVQIGEQNIQPSSLVYVGILVPGFVITVALFVGLWKCYSQIRPRKGSVTNTWFTFNKESGELVPKRLGQENKGYNFNAELDVYNSPKLRAATNIQWASLWDSDPTVVQYSTNTGGIMFHNPAYVPKQSRQIDNGYESVVINPSSVRFYKVEPASVSTL